MAVTYEIKDTLLRLELAGVYEAADVIRVFQDAMADPRTPKRVALIVDVTRSESMRNRTPDEIRTVSESLEGYSDRIGGRCAVVADSELLYGLSRMGSAYSVGVGIETQVFRDPEAALAWLGIAARA